MPAGASVSAGARTGMAGGSSGPQGRWGIRDPEDLPPRAVDVAQEQWEFLESGEASIGGAKTAVKERKESVENEELPKNRGDLVDMGYEGERVEDLPSHYTTGLSFPFWLAAGSHF